MSDLAKTPEIIARLMEEAAPASQRTSDLSRFARANGWRPSYHIIDYHETQSLANGHLIVEHGLQNAAVISFLKNNLSFPTLGRIEHLRLLSIAYNNLVDWQFFPDPHGMTCVYALSDPPDKQYISVADDPNVWRAEVFDRIVGRKPNPNVKNLDDSLIQTISKWKRNLKAEIETLSNLHISFLFNNILFVRALEDHRRWRSKQGGRLLLDAWEEVAQQTPTLYTAIRLALRRLDMPRFPRQALGECRTLRVFDSLDRETVRELLRDFYDNPSAPYPYDFSLISKHALSRIYEHYVSILREKDSPQMTLFPDLPEEIQNRTIGGIYTPQYIARFFARALKDNHTPPAFRKMKIVDPACGSGIFLRTLLEMQCDPAQEMDITTVAPRAFGNALGIDVDPNACQATRLSLSLLHLVLTDALPPRLRVENEETIAYYLNNRSLHNAFDAVVANPPYVKWDRLSSTIRRRVARFLAGFSARKPDMYLALLKVGMEMTKPGGFLLHVLPHSFLLAQAASNVRREISEKWWIRFLVDLSEIPVFEGVGSYVILLILQKKPRVELDQPRARVVKCRHFVGHALEDALEGKVVSNGNYTIYDLDQSAFSEPVWEILHPRQFSIRQAVLRHPLLKDFLMVREGFITGDDKIFIRDSQEVPSGEKAVYAPYLPDKHINPYALPTSTGKVVFYPYIGGRRLTVQDLRRDFPKTWAYLKQHTRRLKRRGSVRGGSPWWSPVRPRLPSHMMRPKIVTPHLILLPRFALDATGKYAVSRSPLLYPTSEGNALEILRYFLAILNSSVGYWQIARTSHKYSRGYLMLEPKTLNNIRVPDPSKVDVLSMKKIQSLVRGLIEDGANADVESKIDSLVADLYGLSPDDREELQLGGLT